ncbi:MAG: formylmethanofuran dehydrogenase subunit C [Planctomycetales bacterium]
MPLVITVRESFSIPLEVDAVRLEDVRGMSADAVRRILVQHGNRQPALGELCDVAGSAADDETLVWRGDCSRVKLIGTHLKSGRVRVEGDAGMHLGAEMTGGEILVEGNAADWLGAEMHGGKIHVRGNAGHLVGAVYRGGRRGMTGGVILVEGNAGNEIGHTLRRGVIAIGGDCGDAPGFNMLAGTVLVFGECGIRPGAGMRRGTIALLGNEDVELLPTFRRSGTQRFVFLRFYLLRLKELGFPVPDGVLDAACRRYAGDFLESGRGEILLRAVSPGP